MERSRFLPATALVTAALLLAAGCGGSEERSAPSSPPGPSVSPTASVSPEPTESPAPTASGSPTSTASGTSDETWHRSFDFSVQGVAADGEGDAYVTGLAAFGPAEDWGQAMEMVLAKVDPGGERVWVRRWQSTSKRYPDAVGVDVAVSADGSVVYVAGQVMLPPWEATRPWLWAYSSAGELLWSRPTSRYGGTSGAATGTSGVVLGGYGSAVAAWGPDGGRLWAESFEEPPGEHCDAVSDVAVGSEREIYAVGFLDTTPTCGSIEGGACEDADVVIQERAPSGDLRWSTVLDDPGVTDNDWARAVDVAGGDVFVAGERDGRAWLALVSPEGEVVWERSWGGTRTTVGALDVAPWEAVYVASSADLRRFTPEGDLTWERRLRLGDEEAVSGLATAPGRLLYVAAGGGFSVWTGDLWRMHP